MFELITFSWCGQAKQIEWNFPEVNEGNDKVRFLKWWRVKNMIDFFVELNTNVEVDGKKQVQIQIFIFRAIKFDGIAVSKVCELQYLLWKMFIIYLLKKSFATREQTAKGWSQTLWLVSMQIMLTSFIKRNKHPIDMKNTMYIEVNKDDIWRHWNWKTNGNLVRKWNTIIIVIWLTPESNDPFTCQIIPSQQTQCE